MLLSQQLAEYVYIAILSLLAVSPVRVAKRSRLIVLMQATWHNFMPMIY